MSHSLSISIESQLQLWSRTSWPRIPGDGAACVWDIVDLIAERSQDIIGIHVEHFCLASHTLPAKAGHIVSLYVIGQGHISLFPRGTELKEWWIVYSSPLWRMLRAWSSHKVNCAVGGWPSSGPVSLEPHCSRSRLLPGRCGQVQPGSEYHPACIPFIKAPLWDWHSWLQVSELGALPVRGGGFFRKGWIRQSLRSVSSSKHIWLRSLPDYQVH